MRDNGRGIAPDQLGRIFEPFVQADRERDALSGGLGLGLAIVSNLVERHGGTIAAHSEGRGQGATFTVELPTVARAEPVRRRRRTAAGRRSRVPACACWSSTTTSTSPSCCRRRCRSRASRPPSPTTGTPRSSGGGASFPTRPSSTWGCPTWTGTSSPGRCAPSTAATATLIAATGYGQPQDRLRAADAGFDCHFVKPVSVHDLVLVLDERVVAPMPGA